MAHNRTMPGALTSRLRSRSAAQSGVTVIELTVALGLFSVLCSVALLQVKPLVAQVRLGRGARQLATDLQVVRMKAIAQNRRFRVTFRPTTRDYVVDKEEGSSWVRFVLHSYASTNFATAVVPLPTGVTIPTVNSGGDVIFLPRGHVDGGITITLGSTTLSDTRKVVINLAGRVRVE
jgi:Tfp pilus assembly protein FimT